MRVLSVLRVTRALMVLRDQVVQQGQKVMQELQAVPATLEAAAAEAAAEAATAERAANAVVILQADRV